MEPIQHVIAKNIFETTSEVHYEIHRFIDHHNFPQVHDFYEFSLILSGQLTILIDQQTEVLTENQIFFIKPGQVHDKKQLPDTTHLNVAFSKRLIDEVFHYLELTHLKKLTIETLFSEVQTLSSSVMRTILDLIQELNVLAFQNTFQKNSLLKLLLAEIIGRHYLLLAEKKQQTKNKNYWFNDLLLALNQPENFTQGVTVLTTLTDKNQSYVCRMFQKELGTSPSKYINHLKINYAANLILHSDYEIIDIVYESGFQSVSYFYQVFKEVFAITPQQLKQQMSDHQLF
ncbi:AraC family transcriptional regulator [Enterococcus alcedinis]|uniref:DNA-binding transcriptional regulator ChbR n=1 Tax=Enterococcus alcedinis TaxID=1274384 RepID=A0A917JI46_9ENTE|nr:helix-turn-helix domain-containing protein [Enterococcus alcedinis]MBP2103000.1 AraC family cel operon transcriptional repressor [Enterococcus alcedinis]GGI66527.1 DNA-binding transcriptional regulator ChbR [Enterococcus alcedinis]